MIATMDYVGLVLESSCEINIFGYIKAQAFSTSDSVFFLNWESLVLDWDSLIFHKISPRTHHNCL